MAVVELHAKHGVGQRLQYRALDLDDVFLRHEPLPFLPVRHGAVL
jgi:hypothetical protein